MPSPMTEENVRFPKKGGEGDKGLIHEGRACTDGG